MDRNELQEWVLAAASEATKKAATEKLTAPYHFDVWLDDHVGGRVCSFEMTKNGKLLWFAFNGDVPERAEYPMRIKLSTVDGEWRAAVVREQTWDLWKTTRTVVA